MKTQREIRLIHVLIFEWNGSPIIRSLTQFVEHYTRSRRLYSQETNDEQL